MGKNNSLDGFVAFLAGKIPGPKLAEFVRRAHAIEIKKSIQDIANHAHSLMGNPQVHSLSHYDRMILTLYERFSNSIPEEYRDAGIKMAEHDGRKPLFYDSRTGYVYTLA